MIENIEFLFDLYSKCYYDSSRQLLKKIGVSNFAIIKGEPLSFLAYGEFGKRSSSDIDILVSKATLTKVEKILTENGYTSVTHSRADRVLMLAYSHQVSPWSKPMPPFGDVTIDLNFDLFWGEYTGKRIDIDEFLSDTIEMEIYGVKVKTLAPLKAMVQLVLHHYKEMNSIYHLAGHNCINHNMFKDVYYLWKNNQNAIALDKLYAMSTEYEIIPYVFYVLYYTNQVFQDIELKKYVDAFRTSEGVVLLDYYGLSDKERKPWKVDFKTRLDTENIYELIKDDLIEEDMEKLNRNRRIFG